MRRELRFGMAALGRRPLILLAVWSVPEAAPALVSGLAIARAVDDGFLAGRPAVGLAWLASLLLASCVGAVGSRQVFRCLGDLVEPFRDDLVRRVVGGALRRGVAGRDDGGAVARLTRQVEAVRDTYASVIAAVRGFAIALVATSVGALSVAPAIAALIIPPFVVGAGAFLTTLGFAAARQRACVLAEETMTDVAGRVLTGTRDIVALGAHEHARKLAADPITRQAVAERSLLRVTALTTICFTVGVWIPLIVLLAAGPWLVSRGLTAGAIMGGLTYVLFGLQPALSQLISGVGGNGLRFVVTLGNILNTTATPTIPAQRTAVLAGHAVTLRGITFAYGPHSEPVIRHLNLTIPEGDHLAIVGPSGTGKSTLANILCGLLRPDSGTAMSGGARVADLSAEQLAAVRVLIPQEAFVFTGTIWENITYLRPTASAAEVAHAVATVGADTLVERLGGVTAALRPRELSGGERQLIALVRAYLSPAPAVILDEATCHLDPAAERRAEQAFAERGGTLIVIAHRISSAVRARRILILDGPHATVGDHADLLRTSALYRDLVGLWEAADSPEPSAVRQ